MRHAALQSVKVTQTRRRTWRASDIIWAVVIFLVGAAIILGFTGCTSVAARLERWETADDHQDANRDNAQQWAIHANHFIEGWAGTEMARLQTVLAEQNYRAGDDPNKIAQNYTDYFNAVAELKSRVTNSVLKSASLKSEQDQIGEGFKILSDMADDENRLVRETSAATLQAIMETVEKSFAAYEANRPRKPDGEPTDPPKDDAVTFEDGPEH